MEWILSLLSTLAIFALALLILVFFHELGHFLAAKLFGMRVERFSLGFPPRIFGFKKGETDYCIGATPLGGFVKISGMIDESMDVDHLDEEPKPWEYRSKPVWQRMIVISAGVIFNMILAVIIYSSIAFTQGEAKVELDSIQSIYVKDGSLASQAGFQTGDHITGVNGKKARYFSDLIKPEEILSSPLTYSVIRKGSKVQITVPDSLLGEIGKKGFLSLGNALPSQISQTVDESPAQQAGIQEGDVITSINGQKVSYWQQVITDIGNSKDSVSLAVNRNGETLNFTILPNENHKLGIYPPGSDVFSIDRFNYGPISSFGVGFEKSKETLTGIIKGFGKMFSGDIAVRESLGGPVAIANFTKKATDAGGAVGFWKITAFLSITLAIMNIIPIPVLDGGHLMFLLYEGVTRREPSPKVRMALQQIGFLLIIGLLIFATFNDILRQFG